jgi:hypothetical protein
VIAMEKTSTIQGSWPTVGRPDTSPEPQRPIVTDALKAEFGKLTSEIETKVRAVVNRKT